MARNSAKRGEIWLVDLNPTKGHEIQKRRPVVVMSVDSIASLDLRIVVPLTDYKPKHSTYPWCVPVVPNDRNGLSKKSTADAFQIKCASTERFVHRIGILSAQSIREIADAVDLCIGQ